MPSSVRAFRPTRAGDWGDDNKKSPKAFGLWADYFVNLKEFVSFSES